MSLEWKSKPVREGTLHEAIQFDPATGLKTTFTERRHPQQEYDKRLDQIGALSREVTNSRVLGMDFGFVRTIKEGLKAVRVDAPKFSPIPGIAVVLSTPIHENLVRADYTFATGELKSVTFVIPEDSKKSFATIWEQQGELHPQGQFSDLWSMYQFKGAGLFHYVRGDASEDDLKKLRDSRRTDFLDRTKIWGITEQLKLFNYISDTTRFFIDYTLGKSDFTQESISKRENFADELSLGLLPFIPSNFNTLSEDDRKDKVIEALMRTMNATLTAYHVNLEGSGEYTSVRLDEIVPEKPNAAFQVTTEDDFGEEKEHGTRGLGKVFEIGREKFILILNDQPQQYTAERRGRLIITRAVLPETINTQMINTIICSDEPIWRQALNLVDASLYQERSKQ